MLQANADPRTAPIESRTDCTVRWTIAHKAASEAVRMASFATDIGTAANGMNRTAAKTGYVNASPVAESRTA